MFERAQMQLQGSGSHRVSATRRLRSAILAITCLAGLAACSGDNDTPQPNPDQPAKGEETRVIFNPSAGQLPVPNDILFARETAGDGTMFAGQGTANPVISGIDALDGNSVLAPIDIAFSASLDTSQTLDAASFVMDGSSLIPNPDQNVFLLPLSFPSGDPLDQASLDMDGDGTAETVEVPTFAEAATYQRAATTGDMAALTELATPTARAEIISLDGGNNNVLRIAPLEPLQPQTKYLVVLTNDLQDAAGYSVYPSHAYNFIRDPESPLEGSEDIHKSLLGLRNAISGWEQLAGGYFNFMQSAYDAAQLSHTAPSLEDVVLTLSFTTGGTDSVLKSMAAPQLFFANNLRTNYRKDAIRKLVGGTYSLNGSTSSDTPTDAAIAQTLNVLLTHATLPGDMPNPLYNSAVATAITNGAGYADIATGNAAAAYLIQVAAGEAAIRVHDSGSQQQGDEAPYVDIATQAAGTVMFLAGNQPNAVPQTFPTPAPRSHSFFRVDNASEINPALTAPARVYQGEITLPYYLPIPESDNSSVQTGRFTSRTLGSGEAAVSPPSEKITYRFPFPEQRGNVTVPLLATVPNAAALGQSKPAEGWPVIIFVHGIRTDRSTSLPMANALAVACANADGTPSGLPCYATVAIDQPLHGLAPTGSTVPGLVSVTHPEFAITPNVPDAAGPSEGLRERHFDLTADATGAAVPMDYDTDTGTSGSLFINLTSFVTARSNMQQMALDLLNLNATLGSMDVDADGTPDFDTSRVYFIGHSLGAINGVPFIAVNNHAAIQNSPFSNQPLVSAAALLNTGGGITRLLVNSPSFAPTILQGLANASDELTQGNSGLETYLNVFQGIMDSADVMNFASDLAAQNSAGILLTEIVGDEANPADQTIPNAADSRWGEDKGPLDMVLSNGFVIDQFPAPLAGTEPLVAEFGAVATADAQASEQPAFLVTRFTEGSHGTPVVAGNTAADPNTSADVFMEMIRQTAIFFAGNGKVAGSIVTDASVVE